MSSFPAFNVLLWNRNDGNETLYNQEKKITKRTDGLVVIQKVLKIILNYGYDGHHVLLPGIGLDTGSRKKLKNPDKFLSN